MAKDSGIKVPNQGWDMLRPTEEANIGQKSVIYSTTQKSSFRMKPRPRGLVSTRTEV
jgi:hypothetical protein